MKDGFLKIAAAAPELRVADPEFNAGKIIDCIADAKEKGVKLLSFPELALTGCTCGHLFYQRRLTGAAMDALKRIAAATEGSDMLIVVGLPFAVRGAVYSAAAAVCNGEILGFVPRRNVRGTEFSALAPGEHVELWDGGWLYTLEGETLFTAKAIDGLTVGVTFAADRALPVPPAAGLCAAGATVICELSDEPMGMRTRHDTLTALEVDSKRLHCAVVSAAPGSGESSTDKTYFGLCAVVDDGETLEISEAGSGMAVSEADVFNLNDSRMREHTFDGAAAAPMARYDWDLKLGETRLTRRVKREPFVPDQQAVAEFAARCLTIQATGLIKRMQYKDCWRPVIGVSGGVDSTLVMLACAHAMDLCGKPRSNIVAITMPCFGTTDRTKSNAITIAERLGAELRVVPIGESVKKHFETIGHDFDDHSVVFENAQARERTMVLLDVANKVGGLDVGTKDLSEQADGWCTYNGDQISNYDINAGLTKTMVRAIVKYVSEVTEDRVLGEALHDIWDTPVTPELLPIGDEGELLQKSEDSVGPYVLQDFFLYHMVMRGGRPSKVLRLAERAFKGEFDRETLIVWLKSYCRRFFAQQFKRSASADGPAVMGFTLSPRDGHKMPSDAESALWIGEAESL